MGSSSRSGPLPEAAVSGCCAGIVLSVTTPAPFGVWPSWLMPCCRSARWKPDVPALEELLPVAMSREPGLCGNAAGEGHASAGVIWKLVPYTTVTQ